GGAVDDEVETAHRLANLREQRVELIVRGDVARQDQRFAAERAGELADVFFEALTLEGEREIGTGFGRPLRDRPGERSLVGHTEDEALLAGKGHGGSLRTVANRIGGAAAG